LVKIPKVLLKKSGTSEGGMGQPEGHGKKKRGKGKVYGLAKVSHYHITFSQGAGEKNMGKGVLPLRDLEKKATLRIRLPGRTKEVGGGKNGTARSGGGK